MRKKLQNLIGKSEKERNPLVSQRENFFKGRLEKSHLYNQHFNVVGQINDVTYINDGNSQSVEHTFNSLQKIQHPVVLILGGLNGLEDYSQITGFINDRIDSIIIIGVAKEQLIKKFEAYDVELSLADDIDRAVFMAYRGASQNYVVLFSPASAPVEFTNVEERIEKFNKAVEKLIA